MLSAICMKTPVTEKCVVRLIMSIDVQLFAGCSLGIEVHGVSNLLVRFSDGEAATVFLWPNSTTDMMSLDHVHT